MAHLYPWSLYAAAAAIIMCADADLPAPWSINDGRVVTFRIFPVKKNDLAAWAGSSAKPRTACCAATKALVVLMAISRLKAANGIANGSLRGEGVKAPATNHQQAFGQSPSVPRLTIVNDYAWNTQHFFHSCKSIDNIVRVGEVNCDVQLIVRAVCLPQ
jgi:hypothetical protein